MKRENGSYPLPQSPCTRKTNTTPHCIFLQNSQQILQLPHNRALSKCCEVASPWFRRAINSALSYQQILVGSGWGESPYMRKERQPTITLVSSSEGSGLGSVTASFADFWAHCKFKPSQKGSNILCSQSQKLSSIQDSLFQLPVSTSSSRETLTPSQIGYYSTLPHSLLLLSLCPIQMMGAASTVMTASD